MDINRIQDEYSQCVFKTIKINGQDIKFEVDTGAAITVIPKNLAMKFKDVKWGQSNTQIRTACGQLVPVCGEVQVYFNNRNLHVLILENGLKFPLLGRNFLDVLYPNWRETFSINQINIDNVKDQIQSEFNEIFKDDSNTPIKDIEIDIKLKPDCKPVFAKPYELALSKRDIVEKELQNLVEQGIIVPVKYSNWASPIVAVPKRNGGLRICVDFKRTVNPRIEKDHYPLPLIDEILSKIGHGKIFTVLDLKNAFLQLNVKENCREILTINTHKGLFRFKRLPFGIANAPSAFQAELDKILSGLNNVAWYMDDIIVIGQSLEECVENVRTVCSRLKSYNVRVNSSKSIFFERKVNFLGHEISDLGIKPSKEKTKDLMNARIPGNLTELRSFIGFVNYYRNFVPNMAKILYPLYHLGKKDVEFKWTKDCQMSFDTIKKAIIDSPAIAAFDPAKRSILTTDASSYGLGAVLSQEGRVVVFASRTLTETEKRLPQIQKEALAIVDAIRRFHKYLYGFKFTLITDHQPLRSIFGESKGLPKHTINRLQHYAIFLQSYDYEIQYKKGTAIQDADCLSRLPISEEKVDYEVPELEIKGLEVEFKLINLEDVAKFTEIDEDLKVIKGYIENGFPVRMSENLKPYQLKRCELQIVNDCIFWNFRIVIPKGLKNKVLELLHDQHVGSTRMRLLARKEIWFPNIDKEIEEYVSTCATCQHFESRPPINEAVTSWPEARFPLDRVHIDFYSKFGRDFIIWVDAYSRYIDVKEISSKDAKSVIRFLKEKISIFSYPHRIVTDNGPPFNSVELADYLKSKSIEHLFSPPYHPQSNGLAERGVNTAKTHLKKLMYESYNRDKLDTMDVELLNFLFKYRNTPCSVNQKTPNELMFRYQHLTDLSMLRTNKFLIPQEYETDNLKKYRIGEKVRVINPQKGSTTWIVGTITKILSKIRYVVKIGERTRVAHVGSIRKYREGNVISSEVASEHVYSKPARFNT